MSINNISQQINSIAMALAGAKRIFELMDEQPEVDHGYGEVNIIRKPKRPGRR